MFKIINEVIDTPISDHLSEFSDEVINALINKRYANDIIKKTRKFAVEHSWKNVGKQIFNIIEKNEK